MLEGAPADRRFILAGGLDPGNVVDAIRTAPPVGSRRVQRGRGVPGKKDPAKVRQFIAAVRSIAPERDELPTTASFDPLVEPNDPDPFDWEEESKWR